MRLQAIKTAKAELSSAIQSLPSGDISAQIRDKFEVRIRESAKRMIMRRAASFILRLSQSHVRSRCKTEIMIPHDLLTIGERFSNDASLNELLSFTERKPPQRVLVAGCYTGGEDVQFWLRRRVSKLDGIDIYSLANRWGQVVPKLQQAFKTEIQFQQASIEAIPFKGEIFDCVATSAVLEHVRNLGAAISETARVLRRGGWAWHGFGPLYFSFGADHCISAYGSSAGYDHLLLDDEEYQERIRNQEFFNRLADPNLPFWALNNQFSFATAEEYIEHFSRHFEILHVILKISPDALDFRQHYPKKWATLVSSGIAEQDLLIKSMAVVLRSKLGKASKQENYEVIVPSILQPWSISAGSTQRPYSGR